MQFCYAFCFTRQFYEIMKLMKVQVCVQVQELLLKKKVNIEASHEIY